ncbi:hypothetical protein B7463_g9959, partial [Scytalidium lignicola]
MVSEATIQHATKDCYTCNRRRIRCDRSLPLCRKCSNRGLYCPGYWPRFRWTNAIAVRGRFRGLRSPMALEDDQFHHNNNAISFIQEASTESSREIDCQYSVFATLSRLPEPVVNRLLLHYAHHITPIMVWLDSEKNEYRRLVIPLAEKQPVLRLSILAIAAAHLPRDSEIEADFSQSACQAAILMITQQIRFMIDKNFEVNHIHNENDERTAEGLLATMLTLSNYSLLGSALSHAQSHRHAARILVNTLTLKRASNDELFVFLRNQLSVYDILACTTLFNSEHIRHAILPDLSQGDIFFGHFLTIIHRITIRSIPNQDYDLSSESSRMEELEDEFEIACSSTLLLAGPVITSCKKIFKEDFIRLVQTYHHAGAIYACKRFHGSTMSEHEKRHSLLLFTALEKLDNIDSFLHNLPWPIFIAGICSCLDPKRISVVSNLCSMLSSKTGFKHYANILIFLQELWESSHKNWVSLAREWEERGVPVIAV